MFIDTPANTLRISRNEDGRVDDGRHYVLHMRQESSEFLLKNRLATPTQENYESVAANFTEQTGVAFTALQAAAILDLYPNSRIKIAVYNGIGDSDVRDGLGDVMAHFFLGCRWPVFGDAIEIKEFLAVLQKQGLAMGYQLTAQAQSRKA
jgi:hypothetical protein